MNTRYFLAALVGAALLAPTVAPAAQAHHLEVKQQSGIVQFLLDKQPVMAYRAAGVPSKPYVLELRTAGGINVLRDAPADHKHHHGLMFALGVDGVDFWSEDANCGRQRPLELHTHSHSETTTEATGKPASGFRFVLQQRLAWLAPQGDQELLLEQRQLTLVPADNGKATLLCWQSQLELPPGKDKAVLDGRHYFGLGMRFVPSMDTNGALFNADNKQGEVVRGTEKLTAVRWMAYTAQAEGKPVTVAMFDHPSNPRHPAPMFTMTGPFAYMSATLNLWKQKLQVDPGKPLVLRYAVALWDGKAERQQVEALYRQWAQHRD